MSFKDLEALLQQVVTSQSEQTGHPCLLIVDDDADMRLSLELLLRGTYQVVSASSAHEAIAAIDGDTCAVVLDIKMRGYDGFWACAQLRKRYPDVPIIFYSAWQDGKEPHQIIQENQAYGYLPKDGDTSRLLDMLEAAVRMHRMRKYNKTLVTQLLRTRHPEK